MILDDEDFGPDLLIEVGDCEFHGSCHRCGTALGSVRPDQSLDILGNAWDRHANSETNGMCTGCGALEVLLVDPTGTRDLSAIGESAAYPTGYGCELCS